MIKLKNCPHCGGEVVLCKLNTMVTVAEFSIVCAKCGLETRIYANPMANCCFDMGKAIKAITESGIGEMGVDPLMSTWICVRQRAGGQFPPEGEKNNG